jgi:hypothetical protein
LERPVLIAGRMNIRPTLRRGLPALAFAFSLALVTLSTGLARAQDQAQDIVFGFFGKELPDGSKKNLAVDLQEAVGGLDYWEWDAFGEKFPKVSDGWDEQRVIDALDLVAATDHRAKFNLTGFDFAGDRSPLKVGRLDDSNEAGITAWELAQIRFHRAYWEHTDFYLRGKNGKYKKLGAKALEKLGLHYEAPVLADLDAKKGEKLRSTPDGDVYAVPGEPGHELVVPRVGAESQDARAARIDALADEKDSLDALAKTYVPIARRYELGTADGAIAYVRDALADDAPAEASAGGAGITLGRDASGEMVVTGVSSGHVVTKASIDVAKEARSALVAEALRRTPGADDPAIAPFLTEAPPKNVTAGTPGAKKFVRALLDYVGKDAVGHEIVRLIQEGKLELAHEGEAAANKVILPLGRVVPFVGTAARFVADAVTAIRATETATKQLEAEGLAHALAFAKRMKLPLKFIRERLWMRAEGDPAAAVLESSGAVEDLSKGQQAKLTKSVQGILATGSGDGVDPALLARIQARDEDVASGARTGMSQVIEDRVKKGREATSDAGER